MKPMMKLPLSLCLTAMLVRIALPTTQMEDNSHETPHKLTLPGSPLGIAWGFLYGTYGVPNEKYMPKVRNLGSGFTKIYLLWNQVEPQKGKFDWTSVDAFADQLKSPDEGLIAIFSSSMWATKKPSAMLPPSPAVNLDDYYHFIFEMVKHANGKVRYWQNDAEPNNPIYWSGTKEEFVAQLRVFYKAVKDADPNAKVVVGGYDGLFNPPGMGSFPGQQGGLAFFDYVIKNGGDAFDFFDLRLYANPYTIVGRVDYIRHLMNAAGLEKPIISTEYGGPGFFEFPQNLKYVQLVSTWSQSVQKPNSDGQPVADNTGRKAIAKLYSQIATLDPQTQMFMLGCSAELQSKFERIQARDLVMRNVFALSAGVQKTLYWDLVNDVSDRDDLMTLMYGKIAVMGFEKNELTKRFAVADVFQRMASKIGAAKAVTQITFPDRPNVFLFKVDRGRKGPVYVVWEKRNTFSGEDLPPVAVELNLPFRKAKALDALGGAVQISESKTGLTIPVSVTPIFIERG